MKSDMKCCNSNHETHSRWFLPFLGAFIVLYMCFGAAVFSALELPLEEERIAEFRNAIDEIVNGSGLSYDDVISIISDYEKHSDRGLSLKDLNDTRQMKWDFFGAFAFTGTVVTTIGFGASSPMTYGARMFFVFYSLLGVPAVYLFFNTWLARSIENFNRIVGYLRSRSRKFRRKGWRNRYQGQPHHVLLAFSCVAFSVILLVSLFYDHTENWDYSLAFYYCFTAFSTIGFGDVVSGMEDYGHFHVHLYHVIDAVFIAVGCCCVYSMFNLISFFIKKTIDSLLLRLHLQRPRPRPKVRRRSFSLERSFDDDDIHEIDTDEDDVFVTIDEENREDKIKTISSHMSLEEIPEIRDSGNPKFEPSFKRFARRVQFQQRFVNELRKLSSRQSTQQRVVEKRRDSSHAQKSTLKNSVRRFKRSRTKSRKFSRQPSFRFINGTEMFLVKFSNGKVAYYRPIDFPGHASLRKVRSAPGGLNSAACGQTPVELPENEDVRPRFRERNHSNWAQNSEVFALSIMEDKIPRDL